jgi:hypothetical protein
MSTQAYINRVRILAENSVVKVQYQKQTALNKNPLLAATNCSPNFQSIVYTEVCKCPFNNRGIEENTSSSNPNVGTYDGGNRLTHSSNILDGGSSATNSSNVLSGN